MSISQSITKLPSFLPDEKYAIRSIGYYWDTVLLDYVVLDQTTVGGGGGGGGLTDAQLRATPVPVTGIVEVTSNGTDIVALENTQLTRASEATLATRASQATLAAMEIVLGFLNSKTVVVDTENVDIVSSVLPTGAATETTLAAVNTKTPALGQAAMAASSPVVIASNQTAIPVSIGTVDQVASAPANAAIGVASAVAVAALGGRTGLIVINTSTAGQRISLGLDGAAAVLDNGITLETGDSWGMGEYDFTTGAVAAIASAAAGRLSVQEFA